MAESRPPRLTYLITGLQYGGANIGMARLLSELSPEEFDVTVVSLVETPPDVVDLLPDHVTVRRLEMSSPLDLHRIRHLTGVFRRTDILVCSLFHATSVGTVLGTLFRVPTTLVWRHNTEYRNGVRRRLFEVAYARADAVLADSSTVGRMLTDRIGLPREKVAVLPIAGIDVDRFRPRDSDTDDGATRVGSIGRVVEQKGYSTLLECARRLGPAYQFEIIGEGAQRDRLSARAPDNVRFVGAVSDESLPRRLAGYDVYVQPSRHEGLCMTVIEAMACGLPVVASGVGGITESTVEGETGFLCDPGDVPCFTKRIERLGSDADLRSEMGTNARERVIEQYSAGVLADEFREAVAACTNRQV